MARIFISYRRADSRLVANRIYDRLADAFGKKDVFKDVDNIPPGRDFRDVLSVATANCHVMLVIIGPQWLNIRDNAGNRRLDDPEDFVRLEIETGLQRDKTLVIPVLVEKAVMPTADELPFSLQKLAYNNAFSINDDPYFHRDVDTLIQYLQKRLTLRPQRIINRLFMISALMLILFMSVSIGIAIVNPSLLGLGDNEHQVASVSTETPTATVTLTPTITSMRTPVVTLSAQQISRIPILNNDDWTLVERDFDGVIMILVPVGCFEMGSSDDALAYALALCEASAGAAACERIQFDREQPQNQVCFDDPFWIDKYEVTNAQFGTVSVDTVLNPPVVAVTWDDANRHCVMRGMRLPTEAEWEYTARGPSSLIYPWGNEFIAENVVYRHTADGQPEIVTRFSAGASWVGALHMSGNVWEWTDTIFSDFPYDDHPTLAEGEIEYRSLRGGSWNDGDSVVRPAYRGRALSSYQDISTGFRCARDVDG